MSTLQQFLQDLGHVSPYDFLVIVFVLSVNVRKYVESRRDRRTGDTSAPAKKPDGPLDRLKGLVLDTLELIGIILIIWFVGWFLERTLGPKRTMGGIPLSGLLDCVHFAVVFNWLLQCLRRLMP
jgi:hypothetical protein